MYICILNLAGVDRKPSSSKGKACSIALAVASFVVLIIVLGIAGLALYMGISNTDSPASCKLFILHQRNFLLKQIFQQLSHLAVAQKYLKEIGS